MGLLNLIFGAKGKLKSNNKNVKKSSVSKIGVSYRKNFLSINSIGFFGQFKKSKSGEWVIAWSDSDENGYRGGSRESGLGRYLLYNTMQNKIILQGKIMRPNSGMVAENGYFSIEDWHFGSDLSGTFYVFSPSGETIIEKTVNANIYNSAISENGRYAVFQTANNPKSEYGNILIFFDLEKRVEMYSTQTQTGWADKYEFNEDSGDLIVVIKGIGKFRYDKHGQFIDSKKYMTSRLNSKKIDVVTIAAEEIIKNKSVNKKDAEIVLSALIRIQKSCGANDQGWKAQTLKIQGLAHEILQNSQEALSAFDQALSINPKIGVKRKADALRKKLQAV